MKKNKSKLLTRRVLSVFVILFVSFLIFSVGTDCFAAVSDAQTKIMNFNSIVSEVLKCLYVILWPLLWICGIAMDNSMVYGTWLHLDASLWSLWNIVKNIANFTLGVLVLISIILNLFSVGNSKKFKPVDIIKKTVISGILIQMSWFIVAVVIDLSTILTYSIGGLPLVALQSNSSYSDQPIMGVSAIVNSNAGSGVEGLGIDLYYTYGDRAIAPCKIKNDLSITGTFIVGPSSAYYWDSTLNTGLYFDTGYCALNAWPYKYNYNEGISLGLYPDIYSITDSGDNKDVTYINQLDRNLRSGDLIALAASKCAIVPIGNTGCIGSGYGAVSHKGDDEFFRGQENSSKPIYTVDTVIENSKGYVGPLITIYSSLIDIQSFVPEVRDGGYMSLFVSLLFKIIFLVILIIPIIGLAAVLFVRIGILWLVIAASPILMLIWVFDKGKLKIFGDKLAKALDLGNLIKLVFSPVIMTFAISMSLIFITAVSDMNKNIGQPDAIYENMGITKNEGKDNSYSILGLVDLDFETSIFDEGKNDLSYFITLLFACGIIWFFLIAALKLCGPASEKIGGKLDKWLVGSSGLLTNMPIIPLPSGAVGINQMSKAPEMVINNVVSTVSKKSEENLSKNFPWLTPGSSDNKEIKSGLSQIQAMYAANPNVSIDEIVKSLSDEQKKQLTGGKTDKKDIEEIVQHVLNYQKEDYDGMREAGSKIDLNDLNIEALAYSREQLYTAINSDDNWKRRASSKAGNAVHLSDGIFMLDLLPGTEGNPFYELWTKQEYEEKIFGKKPDDDINTLKTNWDDTQKQKYDEYENNNKRLKELIDKLYEENATLSEGQQLLKDKIDGDQGYKDFYVKNTNT